MGTFTGVHSHMSFSFQKKRDIFVTAAKKKIVAECAVIFYFKKNVHLYHDYF